MSHRTAWGQVLQACGHPYLPDWDDEPYDVITQRYPRSDVEGSTGDGSCASTGEDRPDPPPERADAEASDPHDPDRPPEDDEPPF